MKGPSDYSLAASREAKNTRRVFAECKNDIGAQRTYHKAPSGYRSAAEIGGHVLRFLKDAAFDYYATEAARIVVTVPASRVRPPDELQSR